MKEKQKCYCLYVNVTTFFTSFKIEVGTFLGEIKNYTVGKGYYAVEHTDDDVNYLKIEDIHETEELAYKALIEILKNKVK